MAEEAPALKRDSTMAVTAKVSKIIEKRANGKNGVQRCQQYERSSLISFFYFSCRFQEGEAFLEEHGGVHENAKTRAQQKEIEESEEDSATKLKRTSTMAATAQVY